MFPQLCPSLFPIVSGQHWEESKEQTLPTRLQQPKGAVRPSPSQEEGLRISEPSATLPQNIFQESKLASQSGRGWVTQSLLRCRITEFRPQFCILCKFCSTEDPPLQGAGVNLCYLQAGWRWSSTATKSPISTCPFPPFPCLIRGCFQLKFCTLL